MNFTRFSKITWWFKLKQDANVDLKKEVIGFCYDIKKAYCFLKLVRQKMSDKYEAL